MAGARTALVTGATGGLGSALALALAERGWRILAHGRDRARGEALCGRLLDAGAPAARFIEQDISSPAGASALADRVLEEEAQFDLLVNNAGIGPAGDRGGRAPPPIWEVNYLAAYLLIRRLAPWMAGAGAGDAQIVNIASAGQFPLDLRPGAPSATVRAAIPLYGQSKLALVMATIALAPELAERRIRINAIHPATLMDTPMTAALASLETKGLIGRLLKRRLRPRCSAAEGAANVLALIGDPLRPTGTYRDGAGPGRAKRQAYDDGARRALLVLSERACAPYLARAG
jgi:NAD(P)-dependent dehydrogenase (short-subunit alcohol dehydrogenase family)